MERPFIFALASFPSAAHTLRHSGVHIVCQVKPIVPLPKRAVNVTPSGVPGYWRIKCAVQDACTVCFRYSSLAGFVDCRLLDQNFSITNRKLVVLLSHSIGCRSTVFVLFVFEYKFPLRKWCVKGQLCGQKEQELLITVDGYHINTLLVTFLLAYCEDNQVVVLIHSVLSDHS